VAVGCGGGSGGDDAGQVPLLARPGRREPPSWPQCAPDLTSAASAARAAAARRRAEPSAHTAAPPTPCRHCCCCCCCCCRCCCRTPGRQCLKSMCPPWQQSRCRRWAGGQGAWGCGGWDPLGWAWGLGQGHRQQGGKAARQQGGKAARRQGGKAARRQGGKAARRQGGKAQQRATPRPAHRRAAALPSTPRAPGAGAERAACL
jgi:hypothetical protein